MAAEKGAKRTEHPWLSNMDAQKDDERADTHDSPSWPQRKITLALDIVHSKHEHTIYSNTMACPGPPQPGQQYKFSIGELCDRIKEDFNFLQTQYHK
ncbi:Transducin-like enhancer protein 2 [Eufriesea mexicana]|uniref:Transducin-like enhancer protein 2 n=1 Tax=Eufriesea mexicana TaxID=516756 RepID=A0A310SLJ2_9HYME|nr:Transducin-like enhancer protein 2 [Eufriesea mexicana]